LGDENIKYCLDSYETMNDADALFILTEWKQFGNLDLQRTAGLLKEKVIFDGRNLLNLKEVEELGYMYFAIGKRTNGVKSIEGDKNGEYFALLKNGK